MARVIPNEESWIGFLDGDIPADLCAPTVADVAACIDLTCFASTLNASAQGNTVPTPDLCSLFETSVPGTSAATFTGEFYRDDELDTGTPAKPIDLAWNTLPRKAKGAFIIVRFGCPLNATSGKPMPVAGTPCEVWPVEITSRAASAMASGTPQSFTCTAAVNVEPCESAEVTA
jgi:hypothetical protein